MARGFVSLIAGAAAVGLAAASSAPAVEDGVVVLTPDNFEEVVGKDVPVFVEFYAPCESLGGEERERRSVAMGSHVCSSRLKDEAQDPRQRQANACTRNVDLACRVRPLQEPGARVGRHRAVLHQGGRRHHREGEFHDS